jgi:formylglycine-generating enzyme required for sulfatase activity
VDKIGGQSEGTLQIKSFPKEGSSPAGSAVAREFVRPISPRVFDPAEPNERKRVHRGGSFLCNDQYCARYIVGTRGKGEVNTGTNHLGFRCVKDPGIKTEQQ